MAAGRERRWKHGALAEQTQPAGEVEPEAVQHGPEPQVLGLPQRPGVWAQEVALQNDAIPGT